MIPSHSTTSKRPRSEEFMPSMEKDTTALKRRHQSKAVDDGQETSVCKSSDQADELPFGVNAVCGTRPYMEDTYMARVLQLQPVAERPALGLRFFAVYDGHGGDTVSKHCADSLHNNLLTELTQSATLDVQAALRNAFATTDAQLKEGAKAALVGSTAVVAVVDEEAIWIANCGDSRAVLSRKVCRPDSEATCEGEAVQLTDDHKPERQDEQARIESAGGCVINRGGFRVMGALSMSRAIGDHWLQKFGVIPEPEVSVRRRDSNDEFILLASDGLWNVMSNEEAVKLARYSLARALAKGLPRSAAARVTASVLTNVALRKGSQDNVTAIIVDFGTVAAAKLNPASPTTSAVTSQVIASVELPPVELLLPSKPAQVQPKPVVAPQQRFSVGPGLTAPAHMKYSIAAGNSHLPVTLASDVSLFHGLDVSNIQVQHGSPGRFVFTFPPSAALVHG